GPAVTLAPTGKAPNPSFVVPRAIGSTLVFRLRVFDGYQWNRESDGTDSAALDTVAIGIVPNSPPVADAGPSFATAENSLIELYGGNSYDDDAGDVLSYQWQQVGGPAVALTGATTDTLSFVLPFVAPKSGTLLTFEL